MRPSGITWTPERIALLRTMYPHHGASPAMLAAVNALPGIPAVSLKAVRRAASKIGVAALPATRARNAKTGWQSPVGNPSGAKDPKPRQPIIASPSARTPPATHSADSMAIADAAMSRRYAQASELLRKAMAGGRRKDSFEVASAISASTRLPAREVLRLMGEIRNGGLRA